MSRVTKIVVDNLIKDLQSRPLDFKCDKFKLTDNKTGVQYWVANTIFDGCIYKPYEMKFGIVQSLRFHSALKKWKAWSNINACRQHG